MKIEEFERLKYKNQYLLVRGPIEPPFQSDCYSLNDRYFLYTHKDLKISVNSCGNKDLVLLGDAFDFSEPGKSNQDIVNDLGGFNFETLLLKIGSYSGRFVIIFREGNLIRLFHDATATRKIYFCKRGNELYMASQPHLLARWLGLVPTKNDDKRAFYNSKIFNRLHNSNIGNSTLYDEVYQLMPNHFLDAGNGTVHRYWPTERIIYRPVDEVAEKCAVMIKGFMESIANRYQVMLPVTAGKDSRTLLAATKSFSSKVYYYVNKNPGYKENSMDISVPVKLMSKLRLNFHIEVADPKIDEDFRKAYLLNNEYASLEYLPLIQHYFLHFSDKVNLPGNIATSAFEIYGGRNMKISARNLAKLNHVDGFPYALEEYSRWILGSKESFLKYNVHPLNLFYWEERLGNWGTQIQLEKDIAQEDFNPFNSRDLIVLYLSVLPKHISLPSFKLSHEIIKILWPETLAIPINPNWRNRLLKVGKLLGVLDLYHRIKYSSINGY